MCTSQRIPGVLQVVKLRSEPGVHRVAAFAGSRKLETHVIDGRRQEILLVA